jgi:SAM-dependent methyltransferase
MHPESRLAYNWLIKKLVNDKIRMHAQLLHGDVVDLGCGARPYVCDILANADRYIGVDWTQTLHGIHADVIADLTKPLPIRSESVDGVVTFEVLEHIAEPALMLSEACRILRPGGVLLLSVPFQWWVHEAPWDFYRYTRHGLEYLLKKAGFGTFDVQPTSGFWSMWILKLNYQLARLVRGPRLLRLLVRSLLIPIWWAGQAFAPLLDRIWPEDRETAGYFVVAYKP